MDQSVQVCRAFAGRRFFASEIDLIREVTHDFPTLTLTELSNTLCELLEWKRPSGKLKWLECRAFLEQLQAEGIVSLPRLLKTSPGRSCKIPATTQSDPCNPVHGHLSDLLPVSLRLVRGNDHPLNTLWNQFIERYHYLHYRIPFGANLRYLVCSRGGQHLACLLFSSPAWAMHPRDSWIGWSRETRKRNLQYIVCNSRFLILPWVSVRNLASKILSLAASQLPADWKRCYGYRPLLLETLIDPSRFHGTCYRAANWLFLGKTRGRGRMDRDHEPQGRSAKDIYVYPLCRETCKCLCNNAPPKMTNLADTTLEQPHPTGVNRIPGVIDLESAR